MTSTEDRLEELADLLTYLRYDIEHEQSSPVSPECEELIAQAHALLFRAADQA